MNFYLPTEIIEEEYALSKHKEILKKYGHSALIVTGKSSAKKCGAYDEVVEILDEMDIKHFLFDQIEENPSTDTILKAIQSVADHTIDFVIGIGGGSPMDASKAIALLLHHPGAGINYLYDANADSTALPVICIPTTCGTGSEVTGISVLTRHDKNAKGSIPHRIYPSLALVDYRYLRALPDHVLKSSVIDAFCHGVESFINSKANDYSNLFALEAIEILGQTMPELSEIAQASADLTMAVSIKKDALLQRLIHASTLAGIAIAHTGTSLPHALSYRLTYNDQIPHGVACAYFLLDFIEEAPSIYQEELLSCINLKDLSQLRELVDGLMDFSAISKETVLTSIKEVGANPQKMGTAPFKSKLNYGIPK